MLIFVSLLLFLLTLKQESFFWLVLPLSLFLDLWNLEPLGVSGLKMILILILGSVIVGRKRYQSHKIRI